VLRPIGPRCDDLAQVIVDGRACIFAPATRQIAVLNESASAIWHLIDGRRTVAEVTAVLRSTYGSSPQLDEGVRSTLQQFADLGLLGENPSPPPLQAAPGRTATGGARFTDSWSVEAMGLTVAVRCDDPVLDAVLQHVLQDLRARVGEHDDVVPDLDVRVEGCAPWRITSPCHHAAASDLSAALDDALTAINVSAVALTPTFAMHAAVVGRAGHTVVLPGPSGQGKTTLTAALLQLGWDYVSDEALSLRWSDGSIVPYPRPLALSTWAAAELGVNGAPAGQDVVLPARELARVATDVAPPVGVVMLLRDGSEPPRLERLHRAEGVAELLRRGFTHFQRPQRALELLAELVAPADVCVLRHGDPQRAAALLTDNAWGA
jgi:Coenzyme PQQ synthesis protein D (PqqD)